MDAYTAQAHTHRVHQDRRGRVLCQRPCSCQAIWLVHDTLVSRGKQAFLWCQGPRAQFLPMRYHFLCLHPLANQDHIGNACAPKSLTAALGLPGLFCPASRHLLASLRTRPYRQDATPGASCHAGQAPPGGACGWGSALSWRQWMRTPRNEMTDCC